jgi:hypothetical protein
MTFLCSKPNFALGRQDRNLLKKGELHRGPTGLIFGMVLEGM